MGQGEVGQGEDLSRTKFSPVTISDGTRNWYGLGPVSVSPDYQRKGVGKALIQEGLVAGETAKPWWVYTPERKRKLATGSKRKT